MNVGVCVTATPASIAIPLTASSPSGAVIPSEVQLAPPSVDLYTSSGENPATHRSPFLASIAIPTIAVCIRGPVIALDQFVPPSVDLYIASGTPPHAQRSPFLASISIPDSLFCPDGPSIPHDHDAPPLADLYILFGNAPHIHRSPFL